VAKPHVSIALDTTRLDLLIGQLEPRAMTILDNVAFDIEASAKPYAKVDTGAMRSSIYVSGASGGTSYGNAASDAQALRPKAGLVNEVRPANKWERIVGVAVEYAYWQELQQPFIGPAVEDNRRKAQSAWRELCR